MFVALVAAGGSVNAYASDMFRLFGANIFMATLLVGIFYSFFELWEDNGIRWSWLFICFPSFIICVPIYIGILYIHSKVPCLEEVGYTWKMISNIESLHSALGLENLVSFKRDCE